MISWKKKKVIIIITILKHDRPKKNLALNFLASYDDVIFSRHWYKLIKLVCVGLKTCYIAISLIRKSIQEIKCVPAWWFIINFKINKLGISKETRIIYLL